MNTIEINQILDFLKEAEKLKSVTRHSWTSSGRHESVAEHTWRVTLLALVLGKYFPEIDIARVIELLIIHDLGEAYTGDTPSFAKSQDEPEDEAMAIQKLASHLPEDIAAQVVSAWQEFTARETSEAKLAKALDKIETTIQHNEADIDTWIDKDFEYQFKDGKDYANFHDFMKEFREIVCVVARQKILSAGKQLPESALE